MRKKFNVIKCELKDYAMVTPVQGTWNILKIQSYILKIKTKIVFG